MFLFSLNFNFISNISFSVAETISIISSHQKT
jgi:hypothetical protein